MLDALVAEARVRWGLDLAAGLQVVAAERIVATPLEPSRPLLLVPLATLRAEGARGAGPIAGAGEPGEGGEAGEAGEAGLLGAAGARAAWAVIWCGSALLELESGNFAPRGVSAQLAYSARGEPGAVAWIDKTSAHLAAGHGTIIAFSMLLVELFAGWGIVRAPTRRAALATGIAASLVYWVVGQNFGLMLTGQATDPNLGPVMILFALCLWPRTRRAGAAEAVPGQG